MFHEQLLFHSIRLILFLQVDTIMIDQTDWTTCSVTSTSSILIRSIFIIWVIVSFVCSNDKEKLFEHDRKNCSSFELSNRYAYDIDIKR